MTASEHGSSPIGCADAVADIATALGDLEWIIKKLRGDTREIDVIMWSIPEIVGDLREAQKALEILSARSAAEESSNSEGVKS